MKPEAIKQIDELYKIGRDILVAQQKKKGYSEGLQRILTGLYPDNAHFIFELLANAEDTGATKVSFELSEQGLIFTHNGEKLFDDEDVDSITNIGFSTKADDINTIGKFGVGFKAVFAYTKTPRIYSGDYCFEIHDLLCPYPLNDLEPEHGKTRFEFPFNHSQKSADQAFKDIAKGLTGLKDNVLLFLNNIEQISWDIVGTSKGNIARHSYSNNIIEIEHSGSNASSYWLRFTTPTSEGGKFYVAVVFRLMFKKEVLLFYDDKVKIKDQFRIAPTDGQLSIFFPAEKETTKLRFHIHGPYASTVARDSIPYDNPDNVGLLEKTGSLLADTLHEIKKLGLLDIDFLGVLPNDRDELDAFYKPLQTMAIQTMRQKPLVPTNKGGFAPATELLQGPKEIKDVIGDEELPFFAGKGERRWVKGAGQKNSDADLFIKNLGIESWGWNELVGQVTGLYNRWKGDISLKRNIEWLVNQNDDWMQRFYALLFDAITDNRKEINPSLVSYLSQCAIVRTQKEEHVIGIDIYFPLDATGSDIDGLERVKADVLTGKNKGRVEKAKSFLERAGVKQAGEREEIELILKKFYAKEAECPSKKLHLQHIDRVIDWWLKEKDETVFDNYYIFRDDSAEESYLYPKDIYLDKPYLDTGLSALFDNGVEAGKYPLWHGYLKLKNKNFIEFIKAVGVIYSLKVEQCSTKDNPLRNHLRQDYHKHNVKWTSTVRDEDYTIRNIKKYLQSESQNISKLIWKTLSSSKPEVLQAKFRPNQQYEIRYAPSLLVHYLKSHEWIPDKKGNFYKPSDISKEMLSADFDYDDRNGWLTKIGFGENFLKQQENYKQKQEWAKQLGLPFDFIEKLAGIPAEKREQLFSKINADIQDVLTPPADASFPSSRTPDPEHRKEKARDHAIKADDKVYEERIRTVRTSANANNPAAKEYLRNIYQTEDGDIICQLCHEKMPFQLDGIDYFERQPYIRSTAKELWANHLALCPNCSAEFWYTCATDEEEKKGLVLDLDERLPDDELWIELDMPVHKELRFTQRHLIDLKEALLTEDGAEAEDADFDEQEAEGNEEPAQPHKPLPIPNGKVDKFTDSKGREVLIIRDPVKQTAPATSAKSSLLKCPYCDYSIRQEKYQTHIKDKCPKRPAITGLSHTTQQPLRSAIPRCRFCDSPAIAGSDVCYSCGG